ncbi:hypothetical protein DSO57_1002874 [Entomophthora muscae]|uniref:Uncharacterized protein n=1 Tax=Entomophthora muscae TaxID=34485 RepID=A0ACC2TWA2_9FUNG|nr:hypothetical protein DSO57_1002874 [Entomophthora muscae]
MTDMMEFYSGLLFVLLGVVAILMNMMLIGIVIGIPNRKRELNLSLMLAIVDTINPVTAITTTAYVLVTGKGPEQMQGACKVKGPIDFLIIYASMLLVAVVARSRLAVVLDKHIHIIEKIALFLYTAFYCGVVVWIGYYDEYQVSPSGVDCAPNAHLNTRSALLVFLLGLSLLISTAIALSCYSSILWFLYRNYRNLEHTTNKPTVSLIPRASNVNRQVIYRTAAVCSVYLLLSVPAGILLMMEATVTLPYTDTLSFVISVCVSLSTIANPCLVLFAHSIIYHHFTQALSRRFRRARSAIL